MITHLIEIVVEGIIGGLFDDKRKTTQTNVFYFVHNLNNFINFIELNKPAHLGYKIVYSYMTWDEFDRYNKTWDAWDSLNLNWDDREKYKE